MTLGKEQEAFTRDFVRLLTAIHDAGFSVRMGELWRPVEMQEIYVKTGRSKTMDSMHLKKCAGDLFVFTTSTGVLLGRDDMKVFGDLWESYSPQNRWGGNWRGAVDAGRSSFIDVPHFERKIG